MDFINDVIMTRDLPSIANVHFNPLEKKYLKSTKVTFLISAFIITAIGIIAFYLIDKIQIPVIIYTSTGLFILLSIIGWISVKLSFNLSGYALREKDILFKHGWLIQKIRIVPLKRIQHVSIQSGPIDRNFGLASISIFTAGSNEADFTIKGITNQTALQLKELISKQVNEELS